MIVLVYVKGIGISKRLLEYLHRPIGESIPVKWMGNVNDGLLGHMKRCISIR